MVNDHIFSYKNQMCSKLKKVFIIIIIIYLLLNQVFFLCNFDSSFLLFMLQMLYLNMKNCCILGNKFQRTMCNTRLSCFTFSKLVLLLQVLMSSNLSIPVPASYCLLPVPVPSSSCYFHLLFSNPKAFIYNNNNLRNFQFIADISVHFNIWAKYCR